MQYFLIAINEEIKMKYFLSIFIWMLSANAWSVELLCNGKAPNMGILNFTEEESGKTFQEHVLKYVYVDNVKMLYFKTDSMFEIHHSESDSGLIVVFITQIFRIDGRYVHDRYVVNDGKRLVHYEGLCNVASEKKF